MEINADNLRMVKGQIKPINGMTEKLVSIFNSLNRESFIPEEFKESAYIEKNLALSNPVSYTHLTLPTNREV